MKGMKMSMKDSSSQSSSSLIPTHVVTCILLRTDRSTPQMLLVQRSQRVGTYHAHWAGISGFVEQNVTPDDQAFTEIREETTLQRDQVRMLRRGEIVEVVDPDAGRHFYVHPFLFEVFAPDKIQTDWEAVNMRWIDPSELDNYETVPKLKDAYESAIHGVPVNQA
jgi:8-oxo-dGTP diphosphatase